MSHYFHHNKSKSVDNLHKRFWPGQSHIWFFLLISLVYPHFKLLTVKYKCYLLKFSFLTEVYQSIANAKQAFLQIWHQTFNMKTNVAALCIQSLIYNRVVMAGWHYDIIKSYSQNGGGLKTPLHWWATRIHNCNLLMSSHAVYAQV